MAKLTLYHAAPSRSSITRWMLEEVGEPYEAVLRNSLTRRQMFSFHGLRKKYAGPNHF